MQVSQRPGISDPAEASDRGARLFLGFVFAPAVALLVVWAFLVLSSLSTDGMSVIDAFEMLLFVVLFGAPIAYPVSLFVGLLAYRLITRSTSLARWHVVTVAVLTATGGLLVFTGFSMRDRLLMGGLAGSAAGVTFWRCFVKGLRVTAKGASGSP